MPGRQPVGRQPAQPLEQLHRRRPVGQRRRRGAERHHVRRRRDRAVSGGDVRRPGRARPRARRLRQRRDQERHERPARRRSTTTSATTASTPRTPLAGEQAADGPDAVRRQPRRADRRESHVLLHERRAAPARSDGPRRRSAPTNVARDQRAAGRGRLPGSAGRDRRVSRIPSTSTNVLGKVDHQVDGTGSVRASATASTTSAPRMRAAPAALNAPSASSGLDNLDQTIAVEQHADAVVADGARDARAVRPRRSGRAADRSDRAGGEHRRRRLVRHAARAARPRRVNSDVSGRQQPVAPGGRPRVAGRRRFPLQRRPDHLSALGPRQLHVSRRSRTSWPASTTTPASRRRSASPRSRRRIRTSASTCRTSGKSARA